MGYIFRSYIADDRRLRSHKTFFPQHPRRTPDVPAKLNSSQLRRHVGGKGLRWLLLPTAYVLVCRNGIPGSTGDYVAGSSAGYENQALSSLVPARSNVTSPVEMIGKVVLGPKPQTGNSISAIRPGNEAEFNHCESKLKIRLVLR